MGDLSPGKELCPCAFPRATISSDGVEFEGFKGAEKQEGESGSRTEWQWFLTSEKGELGHLASVVETPPFNLPFITRLLPSRDLSDSPLWRLPPKSMLILVVLKNLKPI